MIPPLKLQGGAPIIQIMKTMNNNNPSSSSSYIPHRQQSSENKEQRETKAGGAAEPDLYGELSPIQEMGGSSGESSSSNSSPIITIVMRKRVDDIILYTSCPTQYRRSSPTGSVGGGVSVTMTTTTWSTSTSNLWKRVYGNDGSVLDCGFGSCCIASFFFFASCTQCHDLALGFLVGVSVVILDNVVEYNTLSS